MLVVPPRSKPATTKSTILGAWWLNKSGNRFGNNTMPFQNLRPSGPVISWATCLASGLRSVRSTQFVAFGKSTLHNEAGANLYNQVNLISCRRLSINSAPTCLVHGYCAQLCAQLCTPRNYSQSKAPMRCTSKLSISFMGKQWWNFVER